MLYAGQELGERGMDKEGYSGVDGRTTIFDYWSVDTLRRWKGNGDYTGSGLTDEEKTLQAFYAHLLNLCNSDEALRRGQFYGIQYANPHNEQYDSHHLFSYLRGTENELLLIVTNFCDNAKECAVTIPEEAFAYYGITHNNITHNAVELLTGEDLQLPLNPHDKIELTVPANSGVIIKFNI
jgi:glycosidase